MPKVIYRYFKCPHCGNKMMFPKRHKTAIGHIKTAYCPICKEDVNYEQVD